MKEEKKDYTIKPDVNSKLKKRDSYLRVSEEEPILVTVDLVNKINIDTDNGIKEGVRITCRLVNTKEFVNEDREKEFTFHPEEEQKIKESYSTSSFYLLKDFESASMWPKEGIYFWVWKASDGLRWEQA